MTAVASCRHRKAECGRDRRPLFVVLAIVSAIGMSIAQIGLFVGEDQGTSLNRFATDLHVIQEESILGLSLVKAFTESHGGSFELESVAGVGTTAIVRFPPERIVSRAITAA